MAKKEMSKKGRIALTTGIIEGILILWTVVNFLITKRPSSLRNMIFTAGLINAGGIVGTPLYIGAKVLANKIFTKTDAKQPVQQLNRGQELVEKMNNVPVVQQTNTKGVVVADNKNTKTSTRKVSQ